MSLGCLCEICWRGRGLVIVVAQRLIAVAHSRSIKMKVMEVLVEVEVKVVEVEVKVMEVEVKVIAI